eukprot:scaffold612_cov96-Skeletonema_dohrnii-CCMP3373.AAC.1
MQAWADMKAKRSKRTTPGIPTWSPTVLYGCVQIALCKVYNHAESALWNCNLKQNNFSNPDGANWL